MFTVNQLSTHVQTVESELLNRSDSCQCVLESLSQHLFFQVSPRVRFLVRCSSLPFKINDIVFLGSSFTTNLFLYADDILLLHPINNPADINFLLSTLNSTPFPLGYLPSSFISTLLSWSICTSFSTLNHLLNDHLSPVNNSVSSLKRVGSFKFLGVLLKPNLFWTDHKKSIRLKTKKKNTRPNLQTLLQALYTWYSNAAL